MNVSRRQSHSITAVALEAAAALHAGAANVTGTGPAARRPRRSRPHGAGAAGPSGRRNGPDIQVGPGNASELYFQIAAAHSVTVTASTGGDS